MNPKNMPLKINTAFILPGFILLLILPVYGSNGKSAGSDEMEKVENNIIIDGLKLNSEKPLEEGDMESQKGNIIFDNSFDDNITELDTRDKNTKIKTEERHSRKKNPSVPDEAKSPEKIIDKLRLKDKRWHLTTHKISGGENLWDISRKYETDYRLIIKVNEIRKPDRLHEGNTIIIPNRKGMEYKVKKGDSLFGIAKAYSADLKKISAHNNITSNKIRVGQIIFIPDALPPAKEKEGGEEPAEKVCNKSAKSFAGDRVKFLWPLNGRVTSAFGSRISPISNLRSFHCGIDIAASEGTPVRASLEGEVIFSGWKDGYGWVVILRHRNGYISVYAHNQRNLVSEGDYIKAGSLIALSGNSGAVTGPHLHFELRKYLTPLNPLRFLN